MSSVLGVSRTRANIGIVTLTRNGANVISLSFRYLDSDILIHALVRMVWYDVLVYMQVGIPDKANIIKE